MKNVEFKRKTMNIYYPSKNFKRNTQKRNGSFRISSNDNKESQLNYLSQLDLKLQDMKRHSVMLGKTNFLQKAIFTFEKEVSDDDDDEKSSDENDIEKNPIDEFKKKQKEEKKKKEEKKDENYPMPELFEPLNEKGKLLIPLKTKNKYKNEDFEVISLTGKGAYGTVLKVKLKNDTSDKFYAIKVMDILALDRIKKLYQAYLECDILSQLESPYIVDILGAFDEHKKIYIVMEFLSKGDFSDFIRLNFPLKLDTIQFYVAEIVNFLDYIQSKKLVHRDLKPENIMMNSKWHLQVIDFATARILGKYFDKSKMIFKTDTYYDLSETDDLKGNKIVIDEDDEDFDEQASPDRRGKTFVGTAEYVSPEVLGDKPAGFGADIWALGIMIYQLYYGKTPFKEKTNYLIFRKIEELKIEFPPNVKIPDEAKDLITKILVKDPEKRLGAGELGTEYDISHLKNHPYFKGIDWNNLHNITPPNSETFDYLMNKKKNNNDSIKQNMSELGIDKTQKKEENNGKNEEQDIVLRKGYLDKKSPWLHYNRRIFILYSTPKLVYIEPLTNKIKGEIYLDKKFKVNHINMTIFELVSPKRVYRFKSSDGDVLVWEKSITEAIKKYGK